MVKGLEYYLFIKIVKLFNYDNITIYEHKVSYDIITKIALGCQGGYDVMYIYYGCIYPQLLLSHKKSY